MTALLSLVLVANVGSVPLDQPAHAPDRGAAVDTVVWSGFEVIEPIVREQLSERWQVEPGDLTLDWGLVRADWTPGDGTQIELKGTGSGGFWVVSVEDGDHSAAIRLRAATRRIALVAARPLARGSVLGEEDIAVETRTEWGAPPRELPDIESGWVVRRVLKGGEVLAPPAVTPPDAVTSGAPVTIEWVSGSVAVTLPGTALGTVPVGRDVNVRTESGQRMRGRAIAPGRVRVS